MNETELLFSEVLNCNRSSLYQASSLPLAKDKAAIISKVLKRRISTEPIQYILGKTEFMGLAFKLTPDVFIPRPETEILVETVLKIVSRLTRLPVCPLKILDLGTGSGNIAISLAKYLPQAKIDALDISGRALEIAKENARLNNVNINFKQGDLFNTYDLRPITYDLIISNPPYIPTAEIKNLQPEIQYEPRIALDGGKDGLDFYRRIIPAAGHYLKRGGYLIMEIGFGQKEAIKNIFRKAEIFEIIEVIKDYNNIDRVIAARKR